MRHQYPGQLTVFVGHLMQTDTRFKFKHAIARGCFLSIGFEYLRLKFSKFQHFERPSCLLNLFHRESFVYGRANPVTVSNQGREEKEKKKKKGGREEKERRASLTF